MYARGSKCSLSLGKKTMLIFYFFLNIFYFIFFFILFFKEYDIYFRFYFLKCIFKCNRKQPNFAQTVTNDSFAFKNMELILLHALRIGKKLLFMLSLKLILKIKALYLKTTHITTYRKWILETRIAKVNWPPYNDIYHFLCETEFRLE